MQCARWVADVAGPRLPMQFRADPVACSCRRGRRAAWLALVGALSGCAMVPYPGDWAPTVVASDGCAHFTGDYLNAGVTVEPSNPMLPLSEAGPPDYLTRIFLGTSGGVAYRIRLDVSNEGLIVVTEIDARGEVTSRTEASSKDFRCSGGKIRFSEGGSIAGGGLVAVGGSSWSSISKSTDGSLVVENTMWAAGIAMAVPVAIVGRSWSRFNAWTDVSALRAAPLVDPYAWPEAGSEGPAPLVLRATSLAFSALRADPPYIKGIDCRAVLGEAVESAMPAVRSTLQEVPAAKIVEEEVRRQLAGTQVRVERRSAAAHATDRVDDAKAVGDSADARKLIVADVRVRFGQVNPAACAVKLVATAEVRVQPADRKETPAPMYDVWAVVEDVPVVAWARDPHAARDSLARLLRQVGRELAASYRERTRCSGADC